MRNGFILAQALVGLATWLWSRLLILPNQLVEGIFLHFGLMAFDVILSRSKQSAIILQFF
jgi:hypothetical protein